MSSVTPEIHEHVGHGPVADLAARRAYEQAWAQFAAQQSPEEFCRNWLVIQCHAIGGVSDGVVVLQRPGSSTFSPIAYYPERAPERARLARITESALKQGRGVVEPLRSPEGAPQSPPRYQLAGSAAADGDARPAMGIGLARAAAAASRRPA
jgi:hypothetical protein